MGTQKNDKQLEDLVIQSPLFIINLCLASLSLFVLFKEIPAFIDVLTYRISCHRQLGQQQIFSISGGLEPVSVRFPMNVLWLSPLLQQYVSMSSLDARDFWVPQFSIRLLLLGCSFDVCVMYGLSISSVYVQLRFLYFLAGIYRKDTDLTLFESRRS